ncbi:hypothetical protein O3P69_015953 [Scylla paramamosain]|uniref:Uncharacterized protein n=1 Tax=Scylla paramamosain TaxID=85552 RepID=A0AAW0T9D4_SCYPA
MLGRHSAGHAPYYHTRTSSTLTAADTAARRGMSTQPATVLGSTHLALQTSQPLNPVDATLYIPPDGV